MEIFTLITLLFVGQAVASTYCYRDNCLRALAATGKPAHALMASSDCSRIIAGATVSFQPIPTVLPRGIPVPGLPIYASACMGFARYSSACSCLGVTIGVPTSTGVSATISSVVSSTLPTQSGNITSLLSSITSSSEFSTIPSPSPPLFNNSTSTSDAVSSLSSASPSFTNSTDLVTSTTFTVLSTQDLTSTSASPSSTDSTSVTVSSSLLESSTQDLMTALSSTSTSATLDIPPSASSTTSSTAPSCTANTLTDPMNCGACGTTCDSGSCENGICTSSQCTAQKCGGFTNCNDNSNCFCFSSTTNGFCGANAVCSELTPCANDTDCNVGSSSGNICAIETCCPQQSDTKPGVCLQGQCGNPARKLVMMAKSRRFTGHTAAF